MIARAFHSWERKLASSASRTVRPFEWGPDGLRDQHIPRRRIRVRLAGLGRADGRSTARRSMPSRPPTTTRWTATA